MSALVCPCCGQRSAAVDPGDVIAGLPLSKLERRIAGAMVARFGRYVETRTLVDAAWFDDADGGPMHAENAVSVHVHQLRRKLNGSGIAIEGGPYRGRRMRLTDSSSHIPADGWSGPAWRRET